MSTKYEGNFAEALAWLESEIKARRDWLGVNWVDDDSGSDHVVKVLDYACGPGTVSRVSAGQIISSWSFIFLLHVGTIGSRD